MADQNLDQLKSKYQSVLNLMQQEHVQLKNVHLEGGKLVIRGHGKTKQEVNKVWNQIKLVDSNYTADLMAEFSYDTDAPAASAAPARTHTVAQGETLSAIAKTYYGKASEYPRIFEANRDQLSNPDLIKPGQVLKIPA